MKLPYGKLAEIEQKSKCCSPHESRSTPQHSTFMQVCRQNGVASYPKYTYKETESELPRALMLRASAQAIEACGDHPPHLPLCFDQD